jgi:hypothetical protein
MKSRIRKIFETRFWRKKKIYHLELMHVFNFIFLKKSQLNGAIMTLNDIMRKNP